MRHHRARLGAALAVLAVAFTGGVATAQEPTVPAPEEQANAEPVVEHVVEFDKPGYKTGDTAVITLTITNAGTDDTLVHGRAVFPPEPGQVHIDYAAWGELLSHDGDGVRLAPGASYVHELKGVIADPEATEALFNARLILNEHSVVPMRATAPVEKAHGTVAGTAYLDRNGNRVVDAGEPVGGAKVTVGNYFSQDWPRAVTDDQGRFTVSSLAPLEHHISVETLDGWEFRSTSVAIVADKTVDIDIAGVRPFKEGLAAQVRFTKDEYEPGDVAEIDVTLTNTGTVRLAGITAQCDRSGNSAHVTGIEWGELTYGGDGLALDPGKTFRTRVRGTVPEAARKYGVAMVACDFGFDASTNPTASDLARVPGAKGSVTVTTFQDRDRDRSVDRDERIGGLDVTLTDQATGKVSVTRRANVDGVASFKDIPAGRYDVTVSGPWDVEPNQPDVGVYSGGCWHTCDFHISLAPGDAAPPPSSSSPAPQPTTTSPAPQASAPPANLPNTGADVRRLFGVGVLAVLAGAGLLLVRRKRA